MSQNLFMLDPCRECLKTIPSIPCIIFHWRRMMKTPSSDKQILSLISFEGVPGASVRRAFLPEGFKSWGDKHRGGAPATLWKTNRARGKGDRDLQSTENPAALCCYASAEHCQWALSATPQGPGSLCPRHKYTPQPGRMEITGAPSC